MSCSYPKCFQPKAEKPSGGHWSQCETHLKRGREYAAQYRQRKKAKMEPVAESLAAEEPHETEAPPVVCVSRIGDHAVYTGDCEDVLKAFPDLKADVALFSPPYNSHQKMYGDDAPFDDALDETVYLLKMDRLFRILDCHLAENATVLMQLGYFERKPSLPFVLASEVERTTPWQIVDVIAWRKDKCVTQASSSRALSRICEWVFVFARKTEVKTYKTNRKQISRSPTGQPFFEIAYNMVLAPNSDGLGGPNGATFSRELASKLLDLYAAPDAVVLDPFCGSGTVLVTAALTGRRGIGIDIWKEMTELTCERLYHVAENDCDIDGQTVQEAWTKTHKKAVATLRAE